MNFYFDEIELSNTRQTLDYIDPQFLINFPKQLQELRDKMNALAASEPKLTWDQVSTALQADPNWASWITRLTKNPDDNDRGLNWGTATVVQKEQVLEFFEEWFYVLKIGPDLFHVLTDLHCSKPGSDAVLTQQKKAGKDYEVPDDTGNPNNAYVSLKHLKFISELKVLHALKTEAELIHQPGTLIQSIIDFYKKMASLNGTWFYDNKDKDATEIELKRKAIEVYQRENFYRPLLDVTGTDSDKMNQVINLFDPKLTFEEFYERYQALNGSFFKPNFNNAGVASFIYAKLQLAAVFNFSLRYVQNTSAEVYKNKGLAAHALFELKDLGLSEAVEMGLYAFIKNFLEHLDDDDDIALFLKELNTPAFRQSLRENQGRLEAFSGDDENDTKEKFKQIFSYIREESRGLFGYILNNMDINTMLEEENLFDRAALPADPHTIRTIAKNLDEDWKKLEFGKGKKSYSLIGDLKAYERLLESLKEVLSAKGSDFVGKDVEIYRKNYKKIYKIKTYLDRLKESHKKMCQLLNRMEDSTRRLERIAEKYPNIYVGNKGILGSGYLKEYRDELEKVREAFEADQKMIQALEEQLEKAEEVRAKLANHINHTPPILVKPGEHGLGPVSYKIVDSDENLDEHIENFFTDGLDAEDLVQLREEDTEEDLSVSEGTHSSKKHYAAEVPDRRFGEKIIYYFESNDSLAAVIETKVLGTVSDSSWRVESKHESTDDHTNPQGDNKAKAFSIASMALLIRTNTLDLNKKESFFKSKEKELQPKKGLTIRDGRSPANEGYLTYLLFRKMGVEDKNISIIGFSIPDNMKTEEGLARLQQKLTSHYPNVNELVQQASEEWKSFSTSHKETHDALKENKKLSEKVSDMVEDEKERLSKIDKKGFNSIRVH